MVLPLIFPIIHVAVHAVAICGDIIINGATVYQAFQPYLDAGRNIFSLVGMLEENWKDIKTINLQYLELAQRIENLLGALSHRYPSDTIAVNDQQMQIKFKKLAYYLDDVQSRIENILKVSKKNALVKATWNRKKAFEDVVKFNAQIDRFRDDFGFQHDLYKAADDDAFKDLVKNALKNQENTIDEIFKQGLNCEKLIVHLNIQNEQLVETVAAMQEALSQHLVGDLKRYNTTLELLKVRSSAYQSSKSTPVTSFYTINENELDYGDKKIPVAAGSFGEIYMAVWDRQLVAVKIAKTKITGSDDIAFLKKEASIWFSFKHPNVVPLWGGNVDAGLPFLVMPFMKNGCLLSYFLQNDSDLDQRKGWVHDISLGMKYLHKMNTSHGDLKTDNVLVDERLRAVITDFGMSRIKTATNSTSSTNNRKTCAVRFIAPERYKRRSVICESSDVFAFAMTAYHIISTKLPFYEEDKDEIVMKFIIDSERPDRQDPVTKIKLVPDENLWGILESCWEHEPAKRPTFENICDILKMIRKKSKQVPGSSPSTSASTVLMNSVSTANNDAARDEYRAKPSLLVPSSRYSSSTTLSEANPSVSRCESHSS